MKKWQSQLGNGGACSTVSSFSRAGFVLLDHWDLVGGDFCAKRLLDEVSPEILVGVFQGGGEGGTRGNHGNCFQKERDPTSEGLETLVAAPEVVVAPPSKRWTNWEEQVD